MTSIRDIRTRIKSIESTRQITKSIKMAASSKLRKTENALHAQSSFALAVRGVMERVSQGGEVQSPFFEGDRQQNRVCYVVFVSNGGFCGSYNNSVLRYAEELAREDGRDSCFVVCGRHSKEGMTVGDRQVDKLFRDIGDIPDSAQAREIADYLVKLYSEGNADKIVLVYQQFASVLSQKPGSIDLLPVKKPEAGKNEGSGYIFEPDEQSLLDLLMQFYLDNTVYHVLLEAKTAEHAAKMTAMTRASDNTEELLSKLNLQLNDARQSAITTEISEIAGGAQALGGGY